MAYQPLEKLLPKAANSIYSLVLLGSKRATELAEGMPKLINMPLEIKTTTLALEEILQGKVVLKGCEDQASPESKVVVQVGEKENPKQGSEEQG